MISRQLSTYLVGEIAASIGHETRIGSALTRRPKLITPSMVALIQRARPGIALTDPDRRRQRSPSHRF